MACRRATVTATARRDEIVASVAAAATSPRFLGAFTVSELALLGNEGDLAFARDGLKVGDTTGNGGGVPVYKSQGEWRTYNNDATVAS